MLDILSSMTARIIQVLIDRYNTGLIDYTTLASHIDKKISFIEENFSEIKDSSVKIEVIYTLRLFARTNRQKSALTI